jgi:hypothetical protein
MVISIFICSSWEVGATVVLPGDDDVAGCPTRVSFPQPATVSPTTVSAAQTASALLVVASTSVT